MTLPNEPTSKELLAQLAAMRVELDKLRAAYEPLSNAYNEIRDKSKNAYEEYRRLEREAYALHEELNSTDYKGRQLAEQVRKLEQEANRKMLQEQLREKIKQSIELFKEKTLAASWRQENRDDGQGAKSHQIEGGYTIALARGGYIFDKRGLGKTLTSLVSTDLLDVAKLVIVVPNDVATQYAREIQKWAPHRHVIPFYQLSKTQRDMWFSILPGIEEWTIVINYEAWRRDFSVIEEISKLQPTCIVADEAHLINKTAMKQWQGVWYLRSHPNKCPTCNHNDIFFDTKLSKTICKLCGEIGNNIRITGKWSEDTFRWTSVNKSVILMTGSPMLNRPQEIYPLLRLQQPDEFFNEEEFLRDYCHHLRGSRWTWKSGGYDMLVRRIQDRLVIRDRKSAGVIIPPQEVQIHEIELDPAVYPGQARALEQIKNYGQLLMSESEDSDIMMMNIYLEVLLRLRQGITWPAGIKLAIKDKEGKVVEEKNLEVYESIKVDWTMDMIHQLVDEGERVLVFSHFNAPLEELYRRLSNAKITSVVYNGHTPRWLKDEAKIDFDPNYCGENPKYKVLLGHYSSAGTGLNLHAATQAILLDEEWNPGKEDQAMGRIDRMGTTRETTVHIPRVINSTADMFMAQLLSEKSETVGLFDTAAKRFSALRDAMNRKDML